MSSLPVPTTLKATLDPSFGRESFTAFAAWFEVEFVTHGSSPLKWIARHIRKGSCTVILSHAKTVDHFSFKYPLTTLA
jgi:hypothetical protein